MVSLADEAFLRRIRLATLSRRGLRSGPQTMADVVPVSRCYSFEGPIERADGTDPLTVGR